jgi:hypothetical protein
MTDPSYINDSDAGLYRAIPPAFVVEGEVLADAFLATRAENQQLSVDQARLSTPEATFVRRPSPPHSVRALTVGEIAKVASDHNVEVPVIDDHDDADPVLAAHASIDMSGLATKPARRAFAAALLLRSISVYQ